MKMPKMRPTLTQPHFPNEIKPSPYTAPHFPNEIKPSPYTAPHFPMPTSTKHENDATSPSAAIPSTQGFAQAFHGAS
jgi:hypothetical protein